jgi:hypothetical protein
LDKGEAIPTELTLEIIEKWIEDDSVSHQGYVLEWCFGSSDTDAIKHVRTNFPTLIISSSTI